MKPNDIIREIMSLRKYSFNTLAKKLGKSTGSAVSNSLARENGMRIDRYIEMLSAMDCELVVVDKTTGESYTVTPPQETE